MKMYVKQLLLLRVTAYDYDLTKIHIARRRCVLNTSTLASAHAPGCGCWWCDAANASGEKCAPLPPSAPAPGRGHGWANITRVVTPTHPQMRTKDTENQTPWRSRHVTKNHQQSYAPGGRNPTPPSVPKPDQPGDLAVSTR